MTHRHKQEKQDTHVLIYRGVTRPQNMLELEHILSIYVYTIERYNI